ncbi:MAG TPA: hypothetical protein VFD82_07400 [Planctomycetota bacterium]|nr:hypothetical protein [Planctomycetota bacterium]
MRTTQLLAALLAPAMACAQAEKTPKWRIDPYTKNDPALMAKAGYVSFGPFRFGNLADKPVTSDQIDATFEFVPILWTETAHFRIGTNLPAYAVPEDPETKAKLRKELEDLATKLPGINPKTRRLDPWLRAHLTASRLEKLYAETSELFGVKDEDFPTDPSKVVANASVRYMGYGPYLGMKDKYLVLVFDKEGLYRQYMKNFIGRDSSMPQRWHFVESSSILFTCACEDDAHPLKHDTALHCALAFNVSQNLLDGFRYYAYDLPVWMREAFGHWNCRRVDPNWNNFDQNEGSLADLKELTRWEPYCRNLVTSGGKFASFAEAYSWRDFGNITFNDHVALWSRMDWLQSQGPEKWRKFLFAVKGRVDKNWSPDQADLVGATRTALQEAYGVSILDFDRKWAEWVKATYPAQ